MKNKIIIALILFLFLNLLFSQIKMEGFFEGQLGKNYESDFFKWNTWDPNFYLETRFYGSPVANSNFYFKFYSDKDNDNYKFTSFNSEAVFTEGHIDFRQEKNGNGFSTTLFTRESGHYWTDSSLLGIVNTGSVNNDGNGQGVRFDVWHSKKGSMTYVFSDYSQGAGDDIHLFRIRQSFLKNKLKAGVFFQRKNSLEYNEQEAKNMEEYNQVVATDLKLSLGRYFFNGEIALTQDSDEDIRALTEQHREDGLKGFFKSNVATKLELSGFKIGTSKFGHWFFTPGIYCYGDSYLNEMGDDKSDEIGYWLNSYYLVPKRAITLYLNYSHNEWIVPESIEVISINDSNQYVSTIKETRNPKSNLYCEAYIEFINGFKGKIFFNKQDDKWKEVIYKHYDFFTELSVENRIAKLLTQFKIIDIGETTEKQIVGIELSANLSDKWRVFSRGMIANDRVGSRHCIFGEIQYRVSGNTELYLQYGPSWYGQYGLVNDDGFASNGNMQEELKFIIKGWF